jgi:hypothetical protein
VVGFVRVVGRVLGVVLAKVSYHSLFVFRISLVFFVFFSPLPQSQS